MEARFREPLMMERANRKLHCLLGPSLERHTVLPLHLQSIQARACVFSGGEDGMIRCWVHCPSSFSYFLFLETIPGSKDAISALGEKMPGPHVQASGGFED